MVVLIYLTCQLLLAGEVALDRGIIDTCVDFRTHWWAVTRR